MQKRSSQPTSSGESTYSIRVATGHPVACAVCGRELAGGAPLGQRGEEPLCDMCLLEGSPQLGLMLALVAVARTYAVAAGRSREPSPEALHELGYFACVYERIAAKSGPMRAFRIPGWAAGAGDESGDADR